MQRTPRAWAQTVAAGGAGLLLVSLWLHWYSVRIPASLLDRAEQYAGQFGILGPYVNQAAEYLRQAGPIHADAWQAFGQIDVILAILAAVAGIVALLMLTGRARGTGVTIAACGGLAAVLAAYRVLDPVGPHTVVHPASGGYVAMAAGAAIALGGLLAEGAAEPALSSWRAPALPAAQPPYRAAGRASVPPPSP